MSTLSRTLHNLRKVGLKDYIMQMVYIGDTKYGRHVGTDRAGNKFFENMEELPLRTRWVEYAKHDYDAAQIEPGWHAWMSYMVQESPSQDSLIKTGLRRWEQSKPVPNLTGTRGAFQTYSTTKPKVRTWEPKAVERS